MADIIPVNVITKADGNPFDSTAQVLAIPTQERSFANIYLVQNGSSIDRYFFKDGLTNSDLELWQTSGGAYSVYTAILSQSSTNNPTATVLNASDSNYLGAITWTRDAEGEYSGAKTGAFTAAKTMVFISQGNTAGLLRGFRVNNNAISITQVDTTDGTAVDVFADVALEIRVYP